MAKILISPLGATKSREYKEAQYGIDGKEYKATFIAKALVDHLEVDKLFLIGTRESMWGKCTASFQWR